MLSVDVPLVSTELLEWLLKNHSDCYMITQVQSNEKASPLVAVYDRSNRILLGEHLAGNQLKLSTLIDEVSHQTLIVPKKWEKQLSNINTQEEYKNLKP